MTLAQKEYVPLGFIHVHIPDQGVQPIPVWAVTANGDYIAGLGLSPSDFYRFRKAEYQMVPAKLPEQL